MSADLAQFQIEGNIGRTPELRYTQNGKAVTDLRVAVNRSYINANNERVENTDWYKVTVWGRQAETCAKYLTKGRRVRVQAGRVTSEAWITTNEAGGQVVAHRPVFHAIRVDFLPGGARTDTPAYGEFDEGAAMDEYAATMEYAEVAPPVAPVEDAPKAKGKRQSRRTKATAVPVPVGADSDDFGDFPADEIPF